MNGASSPNPISYNAFWSKFEPSLSDYKEIIETQASIKNIPTTNLNSSFSLNKNLKISEVKIQYVANKDVMIPWLMPAFDA